jgi:hypothetical protein
MALQAAQEGYNAGGGCACSHCYKKSLEHRDVAALPAPAAEQTASARLANCAPCCDVSMEIRRRAAPSARTQANPDDSMLSVFESADDAAAAAEEEEEASAPAASGERKKSSGRETIRSSDELPLMKATASNAPPLPAPSRINAAHNLHTQSCRLHAGEPLRAESRLSQASATGSELLLLLLLMLLLCSCNHSHHVSSNDRTCCCA